MSRIDQTFEKLKLANQKAFIAYVCAGDPNIEKSLEIVKAIADAGADIIELGLPFSDPLADGIVNQMAADRALKAGVTTAKVIDMIREFRKTHETPIVLFTYLNPVYAYGFERLQRDAADAGADGILLLDLPPDEALRNEELSGKSPLQQIRLIAPTTPADRRAKLASSAEGFIYALSRTGVTGSHGAPSEKIAEQVAAIRQHASAPVCVGFGINTPDQAKTVASTADGVIVGSAIVKQIAENHDSKELAQKISDFVKPLIDACKSA